MYLYLAGAIEKSQQAIAHPTPAGKVMQRFGGESILPRTMDYRNGNGAWGMGHADRQAELGIGMPASGIVAAIGVAITPIAPAYQSDGHGASRRGTARWLCPCTPRWNLVLVGYRRHVSTALISYRG